MMKFRFEGESMRTLAQHQAHHREAAGQRGFKFGRAIQLEDARQRLVHERMQRISALEYEVSCYHAAFKREHAPKFFELALHALARQFAELFARRVSETGGDRETVAICASMASQILKESTMLQWMPDNIRHMLWKLEDAHRVKIGTPPRAAGEPGELETSVVWDFKQDTLHYHYPIKVSRPVLGERP